MHVQASGAICKLLAALAVAGFALPSLRLSKAPTSLESAATTASQGFGAQIASALLALAQLPLSVELSLRALPVASGKEIDAKLDLMEEETGGASASVGSRRPLQESRAMSSFMTPMSPLASTLMSSYQRLPPEPAHGEPVDSAYGDAAPVGEPLAPATAATGSVEQGGGGEQTSVGWPATRPDLPQIEQLNVKCEKNHMKVNIKFTQPFYGQVFSKGHFSDTKCVHLRPNSGQRVVDFDIHLGKCGMTSSEAAPGGDSSESALSTGPQSQHQPNGLFIENTIVVQYDPQVQEIWDQARKLRCTWYDYYEKNVSFRPYNVDMLDAVTANFLGDNIQCWMQIQVGKGPWSNEVAGIVKIGQTMTMVLAIKDDENKFDMLVRNCEAHDGHHPAIKLVDEHGCVVRPKIMAKFQKVRNFGHAATVVSYAHFQAFKFPDSMSVHFQCTIQVCRFECPEPVCPGSGSSSSSGSSIGNEPPVSSGDYAAVGSELVARKERPPPSHRVTQHPHHHHHHHHNATQFRLEPNADTGRVQVKLDTSMLAATSRLGRPGVGAGAGAGPAGVSPPGHLIQQPRPMARGSVLTAPASLQRSSQQIALNRGATPSFAARLGELADSGGGQLAVFAMPRALRLRKRRSTSNSGQGGPGGQHQQLEALLAELLAARNKNKTAPQSSTTSIKTQRTIQVVSPDDVAFSLAFNQLGEDQQNSLEQQLTNDTFSARQVCVATSNVIVAAAATLAALAIAALAALGAAARRRRQLSNGLLPHKLAFFAATGYQHQAAPASISSLHPSDNSLTASLAATQNDQDRQRREAAARNSCIARLYSQFSPASHWR